MHPAYSVIFFTTASGAGYGLLIWMSLFGAFGLVPTTRGLGFVGLALALALITAGLLSSTFHLGHPERAWRAVSQWRSSWLSREGVLAILTYAPAAVFGIGWVFLETASGPFAIAGVFTALFALATVWCTGMIYASLRTIRAWSQPLVAPLYIVLALATGAILFVLVLRSFGADADVASWIALALLAIALVMKIAYWRSIDKAQRTYTTEAATGLGQIGKVRPLDPPHTQPNYVMREMGFRVARKHAQKLRRIAIATAFAIPVAALLLSLAPAGSLALAFSAVAAVSAAVGIVIERWLFFAEAEHVAMVYYGVEAA
jgi:DMSO reductase anchor subunit